MPSSYNGFRAACAARAAWVILVTIRSRQSVLLRTDKKLDLGLTVSPDGRYLLFSQIDYLGSNLMLLENFR
jgi:hypothetical protein